MATPQDSPDEVWISIPLTNAKSIFVDRQQYNRILHSYDKEVRLKKKSIRNKTALKELNTLRANQLKQLVEAPLIHKRQVDRFENLHRKSRNAAIEQQMALKKHRKGKHNLSSLPEKILSMEDLSEEHKGQILEAAAILLGQHPKATIAEVNQLVGTLQHTLPKNASEEEGWKTRESVVQFAQEFAKNPTQPPPFHCLDLTHASEAPMLQNREELQAKLKVRKTTKVASNALQHHTPSITKKTAAPQEQSPHLAVFKKYLPKKN